VLPSARRAWPPTGRQHSSRSGPAPALASSNSGPAGTTIASPAEIVSVYNFGGRITPEPLAATRGEDGRWIGGSVQQWADELTAAVLDHHAAGFIYRSPDDTPADEALARWATEVVPAVREAISR
jgi:hypothetical protein